MKKLSTGEDSTLKNWKKLTLSVFGYGPAVDFLDKKIIEQGENEEVLADEAQFINALWTMQDWGY